MHKNYFGGDHSFGDGYEEKTGEFQINEGDKQVKVQNKDLLSDEGNIVYYDLNFSNLNQNDDSTKKESDKIDDYSNNILSNLNSVLFSKKYTNQINI